MNNFVIYSVTKVDRYKALVKVKSMNKLYFPDEKLYVVA